MSEKTTERRFLGCGDNSCIFERPSVGTNGGCRCFNDIEDRAVRHRVRQAAQRQRQQIIALTSERDEAVRERDAPIPMRLACPACSEYHIDRGEWATRPHKTHLCEHCETEWRPSQRYTVGVDSLTASTGGSSDEPQKEIRE